jgi:hypothetical protein
VPALRAAAPAEYVEVNELSSSVGDKSLILGCASTGAKFTPRNHRPTGDALLDAICAGATIKTSPALLVAEAEALYGLGCRYYHYHARNERTHEQTTSNDVYQRLSRHLQGRCKEMLVSFGASRNGVEVRDSIQRFGEWERVSQCSLPLHLGGAHFVTMQAAVELQIIRDLERQFGSLSLDDVDSSRFGETLLKYQPSAEELETQLEAYSTSGGADYGRTSPLIQLAVYMSAIEARRRLSLCDEVEWVQTLSSYAMTRFAIEHPAMRLGGRGQLNVTLLFGFTPRLPFPRTYSEFRDVVRTAKRLEYSIDEPKVRKRRVTITVGAAVLPQQAREYFLPMDVGPSRGQPACALRRLAAYAAQPDSEVDVLRVGMEDTPYAVDEQGLLQLADNITLADIAIREAESNGAAIETASDGIFERMGLQQLGRDLLIEEREHPLGPSVELTPHPVEWFNVKY